MLDVFQEVVMRIRVVVAIASLVVLPAELLSQRLPMPIGRRGPAAPQPLPPVPEPIARELAYRRLRVSVESYPLLGFYQSSGFSIDGRTASWAALGAGTRAEYRVTRFLSATLDLTSSLLGGPATVQTAEIGTRLRPERSEQRLDPYVDARVGYISAYHGGLGSFVEDTFGYPTPQGAYGARYSRGFGVMAGAGVDYALTRTFFLTTGGSFMRSSLTAHDFTGAQPADPRFGMNAFRYTVGVRYNPIRIVSTSVTEGR
jgi:hypothetical protein